VGHFPLGLETSRGLARQVLSIDLYDLGADYLKNYCEQIRAVDLKAAASAARDHLHPDQLVIFVMGPASHSADGLRNLGELKILDEI
jgi:zinc protease